MPLELNVKTGNFQRLKLALKGNTKKVTLGVLQRESGGNKPSLTQIAEWLEFGWVQQVTPKQHTFFNKKYGIWRETGDVLYLPPRPFFRNPLKERREELMALAKELLRRGYTPEHVILAMARDLQAAMQSAIAKGGSDSEEFPRLSKMTMAIKAHKAAQDAGKNGRKKRRDSTGFALSDRPFASDGGREIANLIAFELRNK